MTFAAEPDLMPLPAHYTFGSGRLAIDQNFRVALTGTTEARLRRAIARMVTRLNRETGIPLLSTNLPGGTATLAIHCNAESKAVQTLGEDESYSLEVDSKQARLNAPNSLGVLRGLETFLQLVDQNREGFGMPAISIDDRPRFPWRGISLDVSRHWMPVEVVKRTLDGMSAVKMNVFHWHLSDDQGFRVESKVFPLLQGKGSDGHYYTQVQVREVIDYARDRGIRVVPEFDMPGHATSWLVGYPELGVSPGPYTIERHWGIFDPTLDPTKEATYKFLDPFIGEMARLFDDEFFHVGGDEVEGKQWKTAEHVLSFMKAHRLKDNHELQRYFNRRVHELVKKHGKRMEGWDEVLDPDLPKEIVIQSWRGQKSLVEAVKQGYAGLLSAGYYLDLMQSTEFHYLNDPVNDEAASLNAEQRARIFGGETCMWAEYASIENIDARIWPRAAAIAERLWSPQNVRDVRSMYTRLDTMSRRLELAGLTHREVYRTMLERLAGGAPVEPVKVLADIVEPVKEYSRETSRDYTLSTPLNRMVDTARPESDAGRNFRYAVEAKNWTSVRKTLELWRDNDAALRPTLESRALLAEVAPVSANLTRVATVGLEALDAIEGRRPLPANWSGPATLAEAKKPVVELLLLAVPGVEALAAQAGSAH